MRTKHSTSSKHLRTTTKRRTFPGRGSMPPCTVTERVSKSTTITWHHSLTRRARRRS